MCQAPESGRLSTPPPSRFTGCGRAGSQVPLQSPSEGRAVRAGWNEYFMGIAHQAATRSTCSRKHVGAVIVRDRTVLSTGYNGSLRGLPHCDEVGCIMEDGHCIATVHAEANAILQAAKNGVSIEGSEIYTTASPCWNCFKLIANAGIKRIYFGEFYREERSRQIAPQIGIELIDLQMPSPAAQ